MHRFHGVGDGARPQSNLLAVKGLLYGTTWEGGDKGCLCGSVFSVDPAGGEHVLYEFLGAPSFEYVGDGAHPAGGLASFHGLLYGTTSMGGGSNYRCTGGSWAAGCGTIYTIDPSGHEQVVYRFKGGTDGAEPLGDLVVLNGKLYGVTMKGGGNYGSCDCGTVFSLDKSNTETVVYAFQGGKDGALPEAGLTLIGSKLYGTTTEGGGTCSTGSDCGTLFTITPTGKEHIIHSFSGSDGSFPWSNVVNLNGTLYGTTYYGGKGCVSGCGTIYRIDAGGNERTVWLFGSRTADGTHPVGDLAIDNGLIYGGTQEGGNTGCAPYYGETGCGTIFAFDPASGQESVQHHFQPQYGTWPIGGLTLLNGTMYGTANEGGNASWGLVFSLQ